MDDSLKIEMRKIVPVAAMVSAGKSKFLNTIYNNILFKLFNNYLLKNVRCRYFYNKINREIKK